MPVPQRTTKIFLTKNSSRSIPKIHVKRSRTSTLTKQLADEALTLVQENLGIEEEQDKHMEYTENDDDR